MNILVLTSNYPSNDIPKDITPVVHYFTKEWVKMGHRVLVLHNQVSYPRYLYPFLKLFRKLIMNIGGFNFVSYPIFDRDYTLDGVNVRRRCIQKNYPHAPFLKKEYNSQEKKINAVLEKDEFVPDVIIGHWLTPQLKLICDLGKKFNAKTALVVHDYPNLLKRDYGKDALNLLERVDILGFRAIKLKKIFWMTYPNLNEKPYFICYSGVPEKYLKSSLHEVCLPLRRFTFVGSLIKRKFPEALIEALKDYEYDFTINYVGDGPMEKVIRRLVKKYNLDSRVNILGRMARTQVSELMDETDCFVMISEDETFGLVYLEAMAHGCITIGSKNEGIDGVIVNGQNGFLCESGDFSALKKIIYNVNQMYRASLRLISENAKMKAMELSDSMVAKKYLEAVVG